jgi:septum formation topological specificity factor MinE
MRRADRDALRTLYRTRCGYCGTSELQAGGELTIDHFQPRSRGGSDAFDNQVYACIVCNDYKGNYWQPDSAQRILHPLRDNLAEHIREGEDAHLVPVTETGRFHIDRLQLNRAQLILQRQRSRRTRWVREHVAQLKSELAAVFRHIQAVEEQVDFLMEQDEPETDA